MMNIIVHSSIGLKSSPSFAFSNRKFYHPGIPSSYFSVVSSDEAGYTLFVFTNNNKEDVSI